MPADRTAQPHCIRTLTREGVATLEQKKSRFTAYAAPAGDEAQAQAYIRTVHEREAGASAVLYAYICGTQAQTMRFTDSHEPSGGLLMLEALKRAQVTDAVVAVARYFGGVQLGAGPLGRAFGRVAAQAVADAQPGEAHLSATVTVAVPYALAGRLESFLANSPYRLENLQYAAQVNATILARSAQLDALYSALADLTQGEAAPQLTGCLYVHW